MIILHVMRKMFIVVILKPRLHDTTCCQTRWQPAVLCIQPVVKLVVQPGLTTGWTNNGCLTTSWMLVYTILPVVSCKRGLTVPYQIIWIGTLSLDGYYVWYSELGNVQVPFCSCCTKQKCTNCHMTLSGLFASGHLLSTKDWSCPENCGMLYLFFIFSWAYLFSVIVFAF